MICRDGLARIGRFNTGHGEIETPTILPVINPNIPTLTTAEMVKLGASAFITNSYIIRRNPVLRERAEKGGVHNLIGFDGPVMTDSGTFQSHVYSEVEFSNQEIVDFQRRIGSDISTILDIFSEPGFTHERAKDAVMETYRRMKEIPETGDTILAGPIQGSLHMDLRRLSAQLMSSSSAGYLPIGGVVPLLENYRYDALVDVIINSKLNSDFSKPIHLFGGGHPMFMGMAVLLGVDMFDSASYVKYARDDRMLFKDGSRELKKISYLPRWSPLYGGYTVKELRESSQEERYRLLSLHNLASIFHELDEVKEQIRQQHLWQYVEAKARVHPYLFRAFRRLLEYSDQLEPFEDLSKKSTFFYFDEDSGRSPYFRRVQRNLALLDNRPGDGNTILPRSDWHPGRPHGQDFIDRYQSSRNTFRVPWNRLLIPIELEETYPFQQMISSGFIPAENVEHGDLDNAIVGDVTGGTGQAETVPVRDFRLQKVRMVADLQFGLGIGDRLFPDSTTVRVSKSTGRIRSVILEGKLLATLRAHDGFFTLGLEGGKRLHSITSGISHRVRVSDDSAEFNAKGYNVFFKFVQEYDGSIMAGNEVLVVNSGGEFIAVGKATVSGPEMKYYRSGMAVKIHRGIEEKEPSEGEV